MSVGTSEDVDFLKDQVQRLNAILNQYQKKYLPLNLEEEPPSELSGDGPHKSWLTNRRLLSPLLVEYDHNIEELNLHISVYQSEMESLSSRVEQITQENTRLHSELQKSLEAQIQVAVTSDGASRSRSDSGAGKNGVTEAIQQQLEVVLKERDSYMDLWKQTSHELDSLQKSDQEKTRQLLNGKAEIAIIQQAVMSAEQALEEMRFTCQQLDEERVQCLTTANTQEKELSVLQDDFSKVRTELKAANIKNVDLKKKLDEITFQLKKRESDRQRTDEHEHSLDHRIHVMQLMNADLEGKLLAAQREAALLSGEKAEFEETLVSVQSKVSTLEQREYEAILHVKESMQIAESALMEKDQACIREQQLAVEIARLKNAMATILQEAGERTKREVELVREECNKSIDKMAVEIEKVEQECGEWQVKLERCQREKKAVEKALEKTLANKPLEIIQTGENLHELQTRVCLVERVRNETLVKLEAANATIKRHESSLSSEKKVNEQLLEEHRKWQKQVQEESEKLREQRIKALGQCDELLKKLRASEQSKEAAEMELVKEVTILSQRHEFREKELLYRLESSEQTHQKAVQELRNLVTAQYRAGAKWKEESNSLSQKFEHTVANLKNEVVKYKQEGRELTLQLNQLKHAKADLTKQLNHLTNSKNSLQRKCSDAESQAEAAQGQVSILLEREKKLLQERRELNKQLDKIKLHIARTTGTTMESHFLATENPSSHNSKLAPSHSNLHTSSARRSLKPRHRHHHHISPSLTTQPLPTSTHPHTTDLPDSTKWNDALSELRHSIRQVRHDLGLRQQEDSSLNTYTKEKPGVGDDSYRVHVPSGDETDSQISEPMTLSRGDLSQHSSHSTYALS